MSIWKQVKNSTWPAIVASCALAIVTGCQTLPPSPAVQSATSHHASQLPPTPSQTAARTNISSAAQPAAAGSTAQRQVGDIEHDADSNAAHVAQASHTTDCSSADCQVSDRHGSGRGMGHGARHRAPIQHSQRQQRLGQPFPPSLPATAYHGPEEYYSGQPQNQSELFGDPDQPWSPPGIFTPWPMDEYVFDGGDREDRVEVNRRFDVYGLDLQDTVVHFDTRDGRREVVPSNEVAIYAPRFSSVRKIYGVTLHHNRTSAGGIANTTELGRANDLQIASTVLQPIEAVKQSSAATPNIFRDKSGGANVNNLQVMEEVLDDQTVSYENFQIVQRGIFNTAEKARLNHHIQAAFTWTHEDGVQVMIEDRMANEAKGLSAPNETLLYEMPKGKPRVRIVKLASKDNALPGEIIDFTIRFDNVGDQRVGNVTIIDNLTTRLEYVPDSASCDIASDFFTIENEGDSLILRWEITKPLKVGQGGVIRFKCKVR